MDIFKLTVAEAKKDFERGLLEGYIIDFVSFMGSDVWTILLQTKTGHAELVDARTKTLRQFQSLDSVVKTLRSVGFAVHRLQGK